MSRALVCAALAALCLSAAAVAALPETGSLVPGRSLAGVSLGESAASVRSALGDRFGVCQGCARTTWYYTYRPFAQQGLAVELTHGRVSAVYTLWQPAKWRAPRGLQLGANAAQVTLLGGPLLVTTCVGYEAYIHEAAGVQTVYYVVDGKLWGFGLLHAGTTPCR